MVWCVPFVDHLVRIVMSVVLKPRRKVGIMLCLRGYLGVLLRTGCTQSERCVLEKVHRELDVCLPSVEHAQVEKVGGDIMDRLAEWWHTYSAVEALPNGDEKEDCEADAVDAGVAAVNGDESDASVAAESESDEICDQNGDEAIV